MSAGRRLARLGLLVAVGLILNLIERRLPPLIPVPGVRLGFANLATMLALGLGSPREAILVWLARFLLASLLGGSLLGPGFWVGAAGGTSAWLAMTGVVLHSGGLERAGPGGRRPAFGAVGLSLAGATAHHVGQIAVAACITGQAEVFALLPLLLAAALPVGLLTGWLASLLLRRLHGAGFVRTLPPWAAPLRGWDLALASAVTIVAALTWPGGPMQHQESAVARVSVGGRTTAELSLARDGEYRVEAPEGSLLIEVHHGAVRVVQSGCDDQLCVHSGWVRTPGRMIVCAPNRVVILVVGEKAGVDAILR